MCSLGFIPTAERLRFMDFSNPTSVEQYRFLLPYPNEQSRLWGPTRPFQNTVVYYYAPNKVKSWIVQKRFCNLQVWWVFLGSLVLVTFVLSWLAWRKRREKPDERNKTFSAYLSDHTVYTLTLLISNGNERELHDSLDT